MNNNILNLLSRGRKCIETYTGDRPYSSFLILGWLKEQPLHVVVAYDMKTKYCFIITAYRPDLEHFENNYKTRKKV